MESNNYENCDRSNAGYGNYEIDRDTFGAFVAAQRKEKGYTQKELADRLPSYYDENKIGEYADGMFRMNVPGLYFNNKNWKPITRVLKLWDAAVLLVIPLLCIFMVLFLEKWNVALVFSMVVLFVFLLGLFVPVYVVGRKKGA